MANARAGSGLWFGPTDSRNEGLRVPTDAQSNQSGEIYAVTAAEARVPPFAPLHIVSDSKYVVDGLTRYLPKWERIGWIGVKNADLFQAAAAALRARSAPTTLRWVKGHSADVGNEGADRLAKMGAEKPQPYRPVSLPPRKRFLLAGASLRDLTQSLAYKGIRAQARKHNRLTTERTLQLIRSAVLGATGLDFTESRIWTALRKDPIMRKTRDFLWKAIHGAQKVGNFWSHVPGYEHRATCVRCGVPESMEHILTECAATGQSELWDLTRRALLKRRIRLPDMSLGLALGCHMLTYRDAHDRQKSSDSRIAKIMTTETAYLIWTLRCQRVISWADQPGRYHTLQEVENRWGAAMSKRLHVDVLLTNPRACGKKVLAKNKVLRTWAGLLKEEDALPPDWIAQPRVLVGIPPRLVEGMG
ncbi:ribonuclease H-like protein [Trametes cingulata]|nr:ribonuclease H-like protein [Trametes cingulata]